MPILRVEHTTIFRYRRAVKLGPHCLLMRPRDGRDIHVVSSEVLCSPLAALNWSLDVFGNAVADATFSEPTDVLELANRVVVQQSATEWPVFAIAASAIDYPFAYRADELIDLGALSVPQYADPDGHVKTWANRFVRRPSTDTLSLLKDLNSGVADSISYEVRYDQRTRSPTETLALGRGSCRDFAVLFTEAARRLGFGARICSGYLYDPAATLLGSQGAGSTHAWAEIYLPGAGWIAFDPTNRLCGGAHLIPIAVGRTIEQVAPVSGSFVGNSDECISMDVNVTVTSSDPWTARS